MSESIRRNDPCPCGSGKKYKKCCMNKQQVVEMREVKEERFAQQKQQLSKKLRSFIHNKVSSGDTYKLEAEFNKRSGRIFENHKPYAQFWMYFFYRFENGLRGVEWFLKEEGPRLSGEELEMAERWANLKPQLIQGVEDQEHDVVFEDIATHERFTLPKSEEHLPFVRPWYGTFGALEPKEDRYYLNGVRDIVGPHGLRSAYQKAEAIQGETGLSFSEVLIQYYPEVFAALHTSIEDGVPEGRIYEVYEYVYTFSIEDEDHAQAFFNNDESFLIDQWDDQAKRISWIGEWKTYEDNELSDDILIGDVRATLAIDKGSMTVQTFSLENINEIFKKLLEGRGTFLNQDDKENYIGNLPILAKQKTVRMPEEVPDYFALYAQNEELVDVDSPIPKFEYKSLRKLVEEGRVQEADDWLKQHEYMIYDHVAKQFGEVPVTADFNKPRKELGLALSPFVTGGEARNTAFKPAESPVERETYIAEKDAPLYEDLGILEENMNRFYVEDLLDFYKDKGLGKTTGTKKKYRDSLFDIRAALEKHSVQSWEECNLDFWKNLLIEDFFENKDYISRTQAKDMVAVVKAFTKWLDKEKGLQVSKDVAAFAKEAEESMLHAVDQQNKS